MNNEIIPKGWKKVILKELIKEVNERNKDEKVKTVLSVTNSRGFVSQEEYFEGTVHSANISNYKIVRKNQFAYNPSRINVGSIDILKNYEEGALSPMYVVFEVDTKKLMPEYFKYYFQTNRFLENVKNNTQGSVRNSLSFKALYDFDYLLPPIEEQEKIVKILSAIDDIILKNREKVNLYIKRKEAIVNSILRNSKYRKKKVKEVAEIYLGLTHKPKYVEAGIPFLSSQNISAGYLDFDNIKYISQEEFDKASNTIKPKIGDVLFSRVGSNLGNPVIVDVNVDFGIYVSLGYLRAKKNVNNGFLKQWISSKEFSNQVRTKVSGGAKNNINTGWLKEFNITIPDLNEQKKIVRILENIDKENIKLKEKIGQYENLKKGLMQQLLTGKIRVKI